MIRWLGRSLLRIAGWRVEGPAPDVRRYVLVAAPHTSNWDFIVMLLANQTAIREVIAFPLNQQGQDLLMSAPAEAADKQLKELSIRTALPLK